MLPRVLTAVVGIPLLVYVAIARSLIVTSVFAFLVLALCLIEIYRASTSLPKTPLLVEGVDVIATAVLVLLNVLPGSDWHSLKLKLAGVALTGLIAAGILRKNFPRFVPPFVWLVLPLACLVAIRDHVLTKPQTALGADFGTALLLLFLCLWAGDTMAFFVGKSIGKHKMAPTISPNKTWEGATANLVASTAIGFLLAKWCGVSGEQGLAIGVVVGTAGQVGDLYESAWKRSLGLKDSGKLLPGHGGVLDRFDSLLFAAPPVALVLYSGWFS